jgi:hypothetical protein
MFLVLIVSRALLKLYFFDFVKSETKPYSL